MHKEKKSPRVFYGWWIVVAGFALAIYTAGIVIYGFTAVFEPIAEEFGWSYTQISLAASLRGLETSLLAPLTGLLADRWGPRRLLFAGAAIIGLGLIILSQVTSLGMFYGAFVVIALGMSTCSATVLYTAVAHWFHRKVGLAAGIVGAGFAFSGLLVPVVVTLVDTLEWRMAMIVLGISICIAGMPLSLLVRHRPEPYGYLPDGDATTTMVADQRSTLVLTTDRDVGAKKALTSSAFWHISVALMFQLMILNAVITHVMPYLSSIGIARSVSSLVASSIALVSIVGRLGVGWLTDRFPLKQLAAVSFACLALGLLSFAYVTDENMWLLVPFLILFTTGYGSNFTLVVSLIRKLFGRSSFGTINGLMRGVSMLGVIAGAPLAGWIFDTRGSYQGIWLAFVGLAIVALILVATTPLVRDTSKPADGLTT